jgi:uncharacterized membrane protein
MAFSEVLFMQGGFEFSEGTSAKWIIVVKHVNAAEFRVVVAAILAVAADAVLVAQKLLKIGAHLVTSLARSNV